MGSPSSGAMNSGILSDWAAPYVTQMLGQTQALAAQPYQVYQGPQTAGESGLQSNVFQGLGSLNFPSQLGQSFSSTGAYQLPNMNAAPGAAPAGPTGVAANYMNPYLQSVLTPQLEELRRQNDITNMGTNAKMTQAGAFGGGRQAIMNAENNRNMMQEMNKTVGQGYANAYDKAMGQYNTEQGQAKGLAELMAQQGAAQRGIEQEGITADYNEFLAQRDYPEKQLKFQQSMLQGLPVQSVQNTAGSLSGLGTLLAGLGGGAAVASNLGYKDVGQLLKQFGLDLGPAS
jgi:phosphoglycolate phosphatase-like HAD superfamily hydrolase